MTSAERSDWLALALDRLGLPVVGILDSVLDERREGETAFQAAERRILAEALHRADGHQIEAAELLGMSPRMLNYHCLNYGVQPKQLERWAKRRAS